MKGTLVVAAVATLAGCGQTEGGATAPRAAPSGIAQAPANAEFAGAEPPPLTVKAEVPRGRGQKPPPASPQPTPSPPGGHGTDLLGSNTMRNVGFLAVIAVLVVAACGPRAKLPEGPAPEYEPGRTWTDAGAPQPSTSASAAPRS